MDMITKIEGIVIRETPYGDTSKIINILSKEHGIIGVMCKGAQSMKSKFRTTTMRFTYGFFYVYFKEDKLSLLKDVDVIDPFLHIKSDILLNSYMAYVIELATQVVKQSDVPEIYDLFISVLKKMESGFDPKILTNILEIKYLDYLGVPLNLDSCAKCGNQTSIVTIDPDVGGYICKNCLRQERIVSPKVIKLLRMYYYVSIDSITDLKISNEIVEEIDYFLSKYYERYTGLYLHSKQFLKEITSM